ncbi:MAG: hypothetical protein JWN40_2936 [Phycisphaerales bacterium]|nr:hypothetical protein [Phycisphaerales bacterium]
MAAKKSRRTRKTPKAPAATPSVAQFRLHRPTSRPTQVKHLAQPPKFIKPKRIHPRHVLPFIREGAERDFHSASDAVIFHRAFAMAGPAPLPLPLPLGELALLTNAELTNPAAQNTASNVGEPTCAANGQVVLYTGNWYAAVSVDGGKTFQFIDPATAFAAFDPPGNSFCCDQVAHYIPQIDTFVWLLQYGNATDSDNFQRLAFAKTADVAAGKWRLFDITTAALNVPGAFLDYPDLAVGANFLYMTTNIFQGAGAGSAVVRIPLEGIESNQNVAEKFVSAELQSFRVAQNCGTTAFFAAHENTSTLRLFRWDESEPEPASTPIPVARWIGGNGYMSRTPDGRRWLDRADSRITGATLAGNELWFAWGVDAPSNHRTRPFIQIAKIDATHQTLLEDVNIFDPDSAICYAALSTNVNDEVGISYMIGGKPRFPTHVVGILTNDRKDVVVAASERGPLDDQTSGKGEWGDYLTVRRMFPNQRLFAATGYTMKGAGDGSNRDCTPRFVVFGRTQDITAGPMPSAILPIVVAPVTAAPQDVNKMPVANPSDAAQIKAAAGVTYVVPEVLPQAAADVIALLAIKPGKERWPVKTGADLDVGAVVSMIVDTTVEELISIARPANMLPVTQLFPAFQDRRATPVETTIWRITADVIAVKQEDDGDYHLVLQGASGQHMIAEVPTPRAPFVQPSSPWIKNMKTARAAIDDKIVKKLNPKNFVPMGSKWVPRNSLSKDAATLAMRRVSAMAAIAPKAFTTPPQGLGASFMSKTKPTRVRLTGVGFFDKVHGQTGVSQFNGIELHPILKVEFV